MDKPDALANFINNNPKLENKIRGLPDLGERYDGGDFSVEVKKVDDVFSIYGNELYKLENVKIKDIDTKSLGGGSPMRAKIYPPCKRKIEEAICSDDLYEYPLAAGDEDSRKEILSYLKSEGINNKNFNIDNIIFTVSSTQAFYILTKVIARPYDVVLMTGPNYGLFTFVPERSSGAVVKILPLHEENNWYVDPIELSDRIDEINEDLKKEYSDKLDYIPRVVAFLNENPHNPLGKVMNNSNRNLLEQIGDVCLKKGVFVIDDLIYRDLTYDREDLALPMASFDKFFNNTITMTGLSKSYGLASIRAGMIVANESIIRGVRNYIFQTMDSSPILQAKALAGAFNNDPNRKKEYDNYFNPIIDEYKYRLKMLEVLVDGLDSINDPSLRLDIEKEIRKLASGSFDSNTLLDGIPNVNFVKNSIPDSGFFALLDYSKLKNKSADGRTINSEIDLLKYMYEQEKIKIILGQSISWPNNNQIIGRVTTALDREELVDHVGAMNKCLRKLK